MVAPQGSKAPASAPTGSDAATPPAAPTAYRTARVDDDDDDDDDLDDLDDVLDSFNAPPKSTLGKHLLDPERGASAAVSTAATAGSSTRATSTDGGAEVNEEDFEAHLIEGMENLLRSLATENPPGVMADKAGAGARAPQASAGPSTGAAPGLDTAEEQEAFQRAVQMMLSGEGMDALGMGSPDKAARGPAPAAPGASPRAAGPAAPGQKDSFEETIRKTMESLNAGGAAGANEGMPADIAALLQQLGTDPSALDGLGDDDDELGGLLDGMMAQLMSKEVLEEPMTELAAKYPEYLKKPPAGVSQTDLDKYRAQHKLVQQILTVFKRPGYTDDRDGKEVAKLVGEMQDLGGPPNEIMGDLPEGFDLGALGGSDGCVVM